MQLAYSEKEIQNHLLTSIYADENLATLAKACRDLRRSNPGVRLVEELLGDELHTFIPEYALGVWPVRHSMKNRLIKSLESGEKIARISYIAFANISRDFVRRNSRPEESESSIRTIQHLARFVSNTNIETTSVNEDPDAFFRIERVVQIQSPLAVERQMRRWNNKGKILLPDLEVEGSIERYCMQMKLLGLWNRTIRQSLMSLIPYQSFRKIPRERLFEIEHLNGTQLVPQFANWEEEIEYGLESGCLYRDNDGTVWYVPDEFSITF